VRERFFIEQSVSAFQPCTRDRVVPTNNGVKRTVEAYKKKREFKSLLIRLSDPAQPQIVVTTDDQLHHALGHDRRGLIQGDAATIRSIALHRLPQRAERFHKCLQRKPAILGEARMAGPRVVWYGRFQLPCAGDDPGPTRVTDWSSRRKRPNSGARPTYPGGSHFVWQICNTLLQPCILLRRIGTKLWHRSFQCGR
jgi:hypothetical protein